ncbi:hypothetical protein LUZ60_004603 [Juncus effusus]|nr:hypothetical protein LUZ60_004603 [Juncus effusus]
MANPPKRCLYEVVGVERDATAAEIRSAYRRLALQLHPDKLNSSSDNSSSGNSTALFQELQHAYEVLSDPKERAYYDSHRSQILFSDLSNSGSNSKASFFDLNLFSYFSTSAFSGFSDTGRGFYKVYGDLFTKIYSQEVVFATRMGIGSDSVAPPPLIGNLDSPYAQVTAFYNYWLGFCTIMDFAWADEYDSNAGPNRRARRIMDEENKKVRKRAKREYNDSIRGLAAFVKKRDKRVIDMAVKKKNEEERKKKEAIEKKKEEARIRMEKAKAYEDPEWAKAEEGDEFDENLGFDDDLGFEKGKKKKGGEEFYCVVCNKKFKSDKQWKNHEQSKKHKEKVNELRLAIEEEELELMERNGEDQNGEEEEVNVGFDYEPAKDSESEEREYEERETESLDETCEDLGDNLGINKDVGEEKESDDEEILLENLVLGRKDEKNEDKEAGFNNFSYLESDEESKEEQNKTKVRKSRRANKKEKGEIRKEGNGEDKAKENGEDGERSSFNNGKNEKGKNVKVESSSKGGGKKGKKDKKKASSEGPSNYCDSCGETFESRNKLFSHLSETGHAMIKSKGSKR